MLIAVVAVGADNRHGFLRVELTAGQITGKYYTIPPSGSDRADKLDQFKLNTQTHRLAGN